jgi:hypothetical protein
MIAKLIKMATCDRLRNISPGETLASSWHTPFEPWVLADICAVPEMERMQLIYAMHKEIERHAVAIQEGQ